MNKECIECKSVNPECGFPTPKAKKRKGVCKDCIGKEKRKHRKTERGFISELLDTAKKNAKIRLKKNRIECGKMELTIEDIQKMSREQNGNCAISGIEMIWHTRTPWKASIDRIDCSKGYTKENTRLVCWIVNNSLSDFDVNDYYHMCINSTLNYIKNKCKN